jgi:hypothetical protein
VDALHQGKYEVFSTFDVKGGYVEAFPLQLFQQALLVADQAFAAMTMTLGVPCILCALRIPFGGAL